MAILPILRFPNPVLRETCRDADPRDPLLPRLAQDMAETMYAAPGVGLAAPQVGVPIRLIVVDPRGAPKEGEKEARKPLVMLNPVLARREGCISFEEGCLSLPDFRHDVDRARSITVRFTGLDGGRYELDAEELFAVVVQHEMDHLDGRLLVDYASPLRRDFYKRKARKLSAGND